MIDVRDLKIGDKVRRLESIAGKDVREGDIFTYRGGSSSQFVSDRNGVRLGVAYPKRWEPVGANYKEDDSMGFKVGDKVVYNGSVEVIGANLFTKGKVYEVTEVYATIMRVTNDEVGRKSGFLIYAEEMPAFSLAVVDEDKEALKLALEKANELVAELTALIAASKAVSKRDEVIEDAKQFLQSEEGLRTISKIVYHVNERKGTVVARIVGIETGLTHEKGMAKVSKGDKFDENIGKAIALHRALGYPVPTKFTNAPQQ